MQIKLKNNPYKKGYTFIFIIIFLSVAVLILFPIAEISKHQLLISKQYYESRKAYYIAESGIERSLFIIENKVLNIIEKENTFDASIIDKKLRSFIKREFTTAILKSRRLWELIH
jgi:competence protein ComGC